MAQMDEELLRRREIQEEFERERFSEENIAEEKTQSIFDGTIMINMVPTAFSEGIKMKRREKIYRRL